MYAVWRLSTCGFGYQYIMAYRLYSLILYRWHATTSQAWTRKSINFLLESRLKKSQSSDIVKVACEAEQSLGDVSQRTWTSLQSPRQWTRKMKWMPLSSKLSVSFTAQICYWFDFFRAACSFPGCITITCIDFFVWEEQWILMLEKWNGWLKVSNSLFGWMMRTFMGFSRSTLMWCKATS